VGTQAVSIEADVVFDHTGPLSPGITHKAGTSLIFINTSAIYEVSFAISGVEPNQFALFVNGVARASSIHGSGAGTQQNRGTVFLTLNAGDTLTLRNHSSASPITLQTLAGGTQTNVNASLTIRLLSAAID
jgi:hypothetical protein